MMTLVEGRRRIALVIFCVFAFVFFVFADSPFDEYSIYFGNLHAHTSYSDGSGRPAEAYDFARDEGKLDFMAITEHNHTNKINPKDPKGGKIIGEDENLYRDLIEIAQTQNQQAGFVTFYGQEFSSIKKGNHLNLFGVNKVISDKTIENGNYRGLYEQWLPAHPEIEFLQFNHPWNGDFFIDYGLRNYNGSYKKLREAVSGYLRTFEVINGPGLSDGVHKAKLEGEKHYLHYLTRGFKIAPSADQDNHKRTWGTLTKARTGVLARERTREGIKEAIRSWRCYASTDNNLKVWFSVNEKIMGSDMNADSRLLQIAYKFEDPDEADAKYDLRLLYGSIQIADSGREFKLAPVQGDQEDTIELKTPFKKTFVYLKIIQWPTQTSRKDFVLTSPVWINVP